MPATASAADLDLPPESEMLKSAYRRSGLRVADLATATGLSVATIHIALNGIRYRNGEARAAVPPDRTLIRLASVLHIHPDVLRAYGRARAADLLAEITDTQDSPVALSSDLASQASAMGRQSLATQILSVFSTGELQDELSRRKRAEQDEHEREGRGDAIAEYKTDQGIP